MSVLSDQRFILIPDPSGYYEQGVTYQILAEEPNTIETWTMKKYPDPTNTLSPMKVMNLAVIDSHYVEKMISDRWDRDLRAMAQEKIDGRNEISFKHVIGDRWETTLTFYGSVLTGKMTRVTDIVAAKEQKPILMRESATAEIQNYIPFDDAYEESEVRYGYESTQLENHDLKLLLEEEMEMMLMEGGFVFAEDGKSYEMKCEECDGLPCVWLNNKENMTLFVMTQREDETEPKHYRHAMYRQMALIINDGPSGRGNRLKLPFCVVAGIREMFPDPGKEYTGHKDAGEWGRVPGYTVEI